MTLDEYIKTIGTRFKSGLSTEHTFRGDLQTLLESILAGVLVTNEPSRVECGAPDYILTKKKIPLGYIEAKDLDADLSSKSYKEQFDRYKHSLTNLVFTNYLDFQFYRNGELVQKIEIGKVDGKKVTAMPENFDSFTAQIRDFAELKGQTIKSSKKLAEMMAAKARLLAEVIEQALIGTNDSTGQKVEEPGDNTLHDQLAAFKQVLIHDIQEKEFADIYAQTITYGMFAARLHDPNLDTFSRQEAAELIPKSNPFLRKLFQYVAGYDLDDRIKWIVDDLAEIFRSTDVAAFLRNFGESTQQTDPIIHFYETFLAEYDPKLRKARGVWYTPEPVVNFIVRAVDDILKTEFALPEGLADTSKTKIKINQGGKKVEREVHRVQILDPAVGTGTFLTEVIKQVHKKFEGQKGIWSNYVDEHLIPRLNGFEILMASYAMAHLKLELLLIETGYKAKKDQRLRVFLTNSLEEYHPETGTLFANWLSEEANEANHVKRDTPVMVVMGNPPYSGESSNKGQWIMNLMEDYKKEPGGKMKLKERNPKMVNDDYVKFIRYGQHFIEKNGSGILAFINPHGYLDSATFRGMRWSLLKTYDKIYTIDLHGNAKKMEISPDGSIDQNVFDIMQGVSINIFIKSEKKANNTLAQILHFDLFGLRDFKYKFLNQNALKSIPFKTVESKPPIYFMVPKNFKGSEKYGLGFQIPNLFPINTSGIKTHRDAFVIDINKISLKNRISDFYNSSIGNEQILSEHELKATPEWLNEKRNGAFEYARIQRVTYRPFDDRWIYYSNELVDRGRENIFKISLSDDNIALLTCRQQSSFDFQHVFISKYLTDMCAVSLQTKETGYYFPLYTYPTANKQKTIAPIDGRVPNLNFDIVNEICQRLGLTFTPEKENLNKFLAPIDIFDYCLAVLHSPNYREKYKEFLKIDFPRIPYPKDQKTFWQLVKLGGELRQIHLLESPVVNQFITQYPEDGDNKVAKLKYKDCAVWINDEQYFSGVPQIAWEFYIGGYQPAQKWLKDRKDRVLTYEDIQHYQKIIVALTETDRLMKEIDKIEIE